jgi:hypothetical protein
MGVEIEERKGKKNIQEKVFLEKEGDHFSSLPKNCYPSSLKKKSINIFYFCSLQVYSYKYKKKKKLVFTFGYLNFFVLYTIHIVNSKNLNFLMVPKMNEVRS